MICRGTGRLARLLELEVDAGAGEQLQIVLQARSHILLEIRDCEDAIARL